MNFLNGKIIEKDFWLCYATYEYSSALFGVRSMYCLSISASMHFLIIPIDGANVTFDCPRT